MSGPNHCAVTLTLLAGAVLSAPSSASAASRLFNFDTAEYGTPDANCVNNPVPPMFNRPEYGSQTAAYIVDPAGCGRGAYGVDNGSDALLTGFFSASSPNSEEIHFSWVDPTNDQAWLRLITFNASSVTPKFPSPTVDIRPGSRITMKIQLFGTDGAPTEVESTNGRLEFALAIRETGNNVPLGVNGGTTGLVEFVGIDSKGSGTDANTPIGGVSLTQSAVSNLFHTVVWEFVDEAGVVKVDVSVDGGTAVRKPIVAFNGNGVLSATDNRGTLDGLIIRKPADDDVTKKWYLNIDDVLIEAPGVTDTPRVHSPVSAVQNFVTVEFIDPAATRVRLFKNGSEIAVADAPPTDFSGGQHTFTGLTLMAGDSLTATQIVDGLESQPSAPVIVSGDFCLDDFATAPTDGGAPGNDFTRWFDVTNNTFGTTDGGTLDGSPALRYRDGGFVNGTYKLYQAAIPATGTYRLKAKVKITEDPAQLNSIRQWQMGAIVNGQHQTLTTNLQAINAVNTALPGNAVANFVGLTTGLDNLPTQTLTTGTFSANQGDNLLVVFSTNVQTRWAQVTTCTSNCNDQGTFNITASGANTSATWGSGANILIDDICLASPQPCEAVTGVTVGTPLVAGQTTVTVNNVSGSATSVKVYKNGAGPAIGTNNSPGGQASVNVTVTSLSNNDVISATQTIGGVEGCIPQNGPIVGDCNQIPAVSVTSPVSAGQTTVTVTGVSTNPLPGAVTVYANDVQIGQKTSGLSGTNTETVTVSALVQGQKITATQTLSGLEGCHTASTPGPIVGSGGNSPIRLSLGLREVPAAGAIGSDGGTTGPIEWVIPDTADPDDGKVTSGVPQGVLISPSTDWQTVTFTPATDFKASFNAGNGVLDSAGGYTLEHLAIAQVAPGDTGPYKMFIDNIMNGTTAVTDFEAFNAGDTVIFRQPSFSGTTSGNIRTPPNAAVVDDTQNDPTTPGKSDRIEWQFIDTAVSRWIRLTSSAAPNLPNPRVDITQPITMRILLLPAGATITQWRSVRTHNVLNDMPITLNPVAIANGLTGPTVETRQGGIQRVEVDFSSAVSGVNAAGVSVSDGTNSYTPASVAAVDSDTIAITFNPGQLPDGRCYTITLGPATVTGGIVGDADCKVRALVGDTTGSGTVNLSDLLFTVSKLGQPAADHPSHDVDLSGGTISGGAAGDMGAIKAQIASPAHAAICN